MALRELAVALVLVADQADQAEEGEPANAPRPAIEVGS